ncbi:MAG: hypothetical protein BWY09_02749 [Candidatus Hydrogenedentes bacterium ADurb.Bin179]|nr:MAG: hypothetical protein BWY09_02749 [Candidatus Hydrogenedentes bacterium ADurb.Bin179]
MIFAADDSGELVHDFLHDFRTGIVIRIACLAGGEENVRILGGTPDNRAVGGHGALAVGKYQFIVYHRTDIFREQHLYAVYFVGRAEPVKEVHKRNARLQRRRMGDERHVMGFLNGVGTQHAKSRAARRHDVAMVAKNREGMCRHRARGNVKHRRRQFPGNFEHVGQHQQQALGRGKGGYQRT